MKQKILLILGLIASITLFTYCSTETGQKGNSSGSSSGRSSEGGYDDGEELSLSCELPKGEGSECSKDDDCVDLCKSSGDLDLSGDALKVCKSLGEDTVERLDELFDDLKKVTDEKLEDLEDEDLNLMCGAVKEMGYKILKQSIENYRTSKAKTFLNYLAENEEVFEIFLAAEEEEETVELLEMLLKALDGGSDDAAILTGLGEAVNDDNEKFLKIALDENERLFRFIHEELIDQADGLCKDTNQPAVTSSNDDSFRLEACILGVYCKAAEANTTGNSLRKDIADFFDGGDVSNFIKQPAADGGLVSSGNLEDTNKEKASEEWTDEACTALKTLYTLENWQAF